MDKIRQQKFEQFLLQKDREIKEMNDYSLLERGDSLLAEIDQFEEENAEFLQQNGDFQDELNKRKCTINFILFPIISDDKVEELLQYHLVDAVEVGLDIEFLMKERAITASELLWPKLAQQYIKAVSQNTQLIGGEPLVTEGEKNSYLPYVKNWISLYNRRFGIDKHSGLEIHQFVLENPNTRKLTNKEKEKLLKILAFYESLKVYSLSEIENEMKRLSQSLANSVSKSASAGYAPENKPSTPIPQVNKNADAEQKFPRDKIRFTNTPLKPEEPSKFSSSRIMVEDQNKVEVTDSSSNAPEQKTVIEIEKGTVLELAQKYPALKDQKISQNSISIKTAPFSLTPTLWNWIKLYFDECGKGRHQKDERERFLESLNNSQHLSPEELHLLGRIFLSLDEKTEIVIDKNSRTILTETVGVGNKIKQNSVLETQSVSSFQKEEPTLTPKESRDDSFDLEFIPGGNNLEERDK